MKAYQINSFLSSFAREASSTLKTEPVAVSADTSRPMRPLEIKRYVRSMRENRQYNYSCDFVY